MGGVRHKKTLGLSVHTNKVSYDVLLQGQQTWAASHSKPEVYTTIDRYVGREGERQDHIFQTSMEIPKKGRKDGKL